MGRLHRLGIPRQSVKNLCQQWFLKLLTFSVFLIACATILLSNWFAYLLFTMYCKDCFTGNCKWIRNVWSWWPFHKAFWWSKMLLQPSQWLFSSIYFKCCYTYIQFYLKQNFTDKSEIVIICSYINMYH